MDRSAGPAHRPVPQADRRAPATEGHVSAPMLAQIASQARILLAPLSAHRGPGSRRRIIRSRGDWAYDVEAAALIAGGVDGRAGAWTDAGRPRRLRPRPAAGRLGLSPAITRAGCACSTGSSASGCRSLNPSALLRWNSDKAYLAELGAKRRSDRPDARGRSAATKPTSTERAARFGLRRAGDQAAGVGERDGTHRLGPGDAFPATAAAGR